MQTISCLPQKHKGDKIRPEILTIDFIIAMIISLTILSMPTTAITMDKKATKGYYLLCTESMLPTFSCENNLTMKFVGYNHNFTTGDIVAYAPTVIQRWKGLQQDFHLTSTYVIHRIIRIEDNNYILKGDNNDFEDNQIIGNITKYQIRYKVIKIE